MCYDTKSENFSFFIFWARAWTWLTFIMPKFIVDVVKLSERERKKSHDVHMRFLHKILNFCKRGRNFMIESFLCNCWVFFRWRYFQSWYWLRVSGANFNFLWFKIFNFFFWSQKYFPMSFSSTQAYNFPTSTLMLNTFFKSHKIIIFVSYINKPCNLMNSPFCSNQVNPFCRVNTPRWVLLHSILTSIDHLPRDIAAKMFVQPHIKQIFAAPNVVMSTASNKNEK